MYLIIQVSVHSQHVALLQQVYYYIVLYYYYFLLAECSNEEKFTVALLNTIMFGFVGYICLYKTNNLCKQYSKAPQANLFNIGNQFWPNKCNIQKQNMDRFAVALWNTIKCFVFVCYICLSKTNNYCKYLCCCTFEYIIKVTTDDN